MKTSHLYDNVAIAKRGLPLPKSVQYVHCSSTADQLITTNYWAMTSTEIWARMFLDCDLHITTREWPTNYLVGQDPGHRMLFWIMEDQQYSDSMR